MTRVARLIATLVLGFLLVSGVINGLARSIGEGRPSAVLLCFIWLTPVALVILLLLLSHTARMVIRQITESRAHLTLAILAVLGFLFTNLPFKDWDRWMPTYLAMASTAFILLLVAGRPILQRLLSFLRPAVRFLLYRLKPATFLVLASGVVLAVTNLISWRVFQHFPHVVDSIDQVFQGHIFASGHTTIPARFDNYFFSLSYLINDGSRIYTEYPFGHSLLLALGSLIHAEWLVNPLLGTTEVIVLYFLGKEAYDERTGRIAALLGVASPSFFSCRPSS